MLLGYRIVLTLAASLLLAACVDAKTYYRDFSADLVSQGKFRTAIGPKDAPFSNADLATNFVEIALHSEYALNTDEVIEEKTSTTLSRWSAPIRYRLAGSSANATDLKNTKDLMLRIARITGLDIAPAENKSDINFMIMFFDNEERREFNSAMAEDWGEDSVRFQKAWENSLELPCIARTFGDEDAITFAMVFIKSELEGLYRKSCIHEEVVQAMGLHNDSFDVRPSIFNDDEEFALMTRHDEYLLSVLYDARLELGMTTDQVTPLLPTIIDELRPSGHPCCS